MYASVRESDGVVNSAFVGANSTSSPVEHERGAVRHACGLLHVVRDDHDRHVAPQLVHELLDLLRADRIERRCRLVEQQHRGPRRERARDAQPLLLSAGQTDRAVLESRAHLVPERGALERVLDDVIGLASSMGLLRPRICRPAATLSRIDIVGNGVGRWNTIPTWRRTSMAFTPRA